MHELYDIFIATLSFVLVLEKYFAIIVSLLKYRDIMRSLTVSRRDCQTSHLVFMDFLEFYEHDYRSSANNASSHADDVFDPSTNA